MTELWKDIKGYEHQYQVSNLGNVKTVETNYITTGHIDRNGYKRVCLTNKEGRRFLFPHRLVAETFIPNPDNLPCVNHKDENKLNNCMDNLEWCDYEYNVNYGTRNSRASEKLMNHPAFSKPVKCIETGEIFPSVREAGRKMNLHYQAISKCCTGERHTTGRIYVDTHYLIERRIQDMKLWIYGKVMSGKTTFASQFEDAYIISTDGNAEYTFEPDKILRVRNYKELNDAIAKLKTIKPSWVIVDTTSYLIDYLRFYWCDKNGVEHESEIAYKGYTMLRSFLWESIFTIANAFDNVMFISHEQEVIEKNKFGREISKFQPVFEEKLRDQMSGLMGIIARTVKSISEDGTAKYELHISNSDDEFGGSRLAIKKTAIPLTKKDFDDNFIKSASKFDGAKLVYGEATKEDMYKTKLEEKKESEEKPKRKSVIG